VHVDCDVGVVVGGVYVGVVEVVAGKATSIMALCWVVRVIPSRSSSWKISVEVVFEVEGVLGVIGVVGVVGVLLLPPPPPLVQELVVKLVIDPKLVADPLVT
jgi:hypothetical protein